MSRPRRDRLTKNADFDMVFRNGRSYADKYAVAVVLRRADDITRVGFVVSGKTGNAPVRNRIKRRLREVWRGLRNEVASPADIVLIGRAPAADAPFEEIRESVRKILTDAGLLESS